MGEWLTEAGLVVHVRRPYAGDALPRDLRGHAGMVVLGGEMGAYDDAAHPWLTEVKDLCRTAVATGTPVLGICLGHQLLAVALGGEVARGPHGQQIGVLEVGWTPEAYVDPLLAPVAALDDAPAVQWNNDVVTRLPDGATALARTPRGELQAARFGSAAWGVQWHPEAGVDIIRTWAPPATGCVAPGGCSPRPSRRSVASACQTWPAGDRRAGQHHDGSAGPARLRGRRPGHSGARPARARGRGARAPGRDHGRPRP